MPTRTYRSRPGARHEKLCACLMEGCGCASYTETETAYPVRRESLKLFGCTQCGDRNARVCQKCETCASCCECAWPKSLQGGLRGDAARAARGDRARAARARYEGLREASIIEYIDDVRYEDPREDRRTFDEDAEDEAHEEIIGHCGECDADDTSICGTCDCCVDECCECRESDDDHDNDDDNGEDDDGFGPDADDGIEYLHTEAPSGRKMGSRVQSLMFSKEHYTATSAKAWAKAHGYKYGKVDSGGPSARYHHLRQFEPDQAASGFGTIVLKKGARGEILIQARVAVPKWRADMGEERRLKPGEGKIVEKRAHGPKQTRMFDPLRERMRSERLHTLPGSGASYKRSRDPHESILGATGWKAVRPDVRRRVAEQTGRDATDIEWFKSLRFGNTAYLAPSSGGYRVYVVGADGTVDWKVAKAENVDAAVRSLVTAVEE
jgi:hypothetical protein